jgi:hypothetical protein
MLPNYRMKLTRLGHPVAWGPDNPPRLGRLAERAAALQLMRSR